MKKRYYDVGTFLYVRNQKRGLETAAIIGISLAASSAVAGTASAISQKNAMEEANDENVRLQRDAMAQQEKLFNESNKFNHNEAEIARNFNSQEAEVTRQWQADMLRENRDWFEQYNSPSAQRARYLDAGLNPTTLAGNLGESPSFSVGGVGSASASPAISSSAPSVPQAHVQPAPFDFSKVLSTALGDAGSLLGNISQSEDIKSKQTFNKYYDEVQAAGLNLTRNQARMLYKQGNMIDEQTDMFRANRDKILEEIGLVQKQGQLYDKQGNLLDEQIISQQIDNLWRNEDWQMSLHLKASQLHISQTQEKWLSALLKAQIAQYLGIAANANAQASLAKVTGELQGAEKVAAEKYGNYLDSQKSLNDLELGIFGSDEMKNERRNYEKKKWEIDLDAKDFENSFMMRSARWLNQVSMPLSIVFSAYMLKKGAAKTPTTSIQKSPIYTNTPYGMTPPGM